MFTGIVSQTALVSGVADAGETRRLGLQLPQALRANLELGASVAVDGVCLTVSQIEDDDVQFDIIGSTLRRTTLGQLQPGAMVNIERSLIQGAEIGGHEVSGHVDTTGVVREIETAGGNFRLAIGVEPRWLRYVFEHGFIAINGVSLTINQVDRVGAWFDIWLIPETLRRTNLGRATRGTAANIEVPRGQQVVVDTVFAAVADTLNNWLEKRGGTDDVHALMKSLLDGLGGPGASMSGGRGR